MKLYVPDEQNNRILVYEVPDTFPKMVAEGIEGLRHHMEHPESAQGLIDLLEGQEKP